MRILNDDEMNAVAGGQGSTVHAKAELPVRTKSKVINPTSVLHTDEEEEPGDGGDGGGGGGGGDGGDVGGGDVGGGDTGGGDTGDTGDTGGDDGYGNEIGDTSEPVDNSENDIQLAKAESDPKADIKLTCNTENGSKTCVSGNADHFIVTTTDKSGNTTAYACGLNPGYSVSFSLELFKSIRGGSLGGSWTQTGAFDCKVLPSTKNG